ncbi:hypothetical protein FB382_002790 [Nocardioides ginsengisegetis]|uniref:HTH cro/C1-type domain-containing protein n=1 Tax=Nocardioides ginsengisegetis TaxID=661491 RepID=A0A7W3J1J4_9ACTN|nr:hypothetical protein [Nocardioides ginsengisegetis]MBA8804499.1 hypothetical protein [Nocardioides ginsengisegetis]
MGSTTIGCDQRIAWLLTSARLLNPDPELARRDGFIKALADQGIKIDNSRISRWESGLHPVSGQVAATYEQALGLTEGSLVAVAAGLRRTFGNGPAPREGALRGADLTDGDMDRLLELIDEGKGTGAHWLRLVGQLGTYDRVYLRQQEWAALSARLVQELAVSVGVGFVRRYEAAAGLIRHPNAQRHLTRAIGGFVMNPDTQVVAPVLSLLTEIADEAAGDLVLRMLTSEDKNLRSAASSVAAVKVSRGHFGAHALPQLESHVVGSLRRGESLDGRLDSFDLAVQLPDESWERAMGGLRNRRAFDLVIGSRRGGELVPTQQTAAVVQRLSAAVQRDTPTHSPHENDAMLRRLLRESLLHAHKPRRHHAALLLAATPYAPAVAKHCQDLATHSNDLMAARALTVLMRVGHRMGRSRVLLQSLAETRPTIRARALVNLGLNPEPIKPAEADALLGHLDEHSRPVERHATMFALGMNGGTTLKKLAKSDTEWMARSATWWLDQGPALHDSDAALDQIGAQT